MLNRFWELFCDIFWPIVLSIIFGILAWFVVGNVATAVLKNYGETVRATACGWTFGGMALVITTYWSMKELY